MSEELKKSRPKSKEYPAISINQAIDFVRKYKNFPVGKPIKYEVAAKECKVSANTKSFRYSISSAKQFGLISTSTGQTFMLLETAHRLVRPTESEVALNKLKKQCFASPSLYKELISQYEGQGLPPSTTLENVLVTYHSITSAAAKVAAQKFLESVEEVGAVRDGILCLSDEQESESEISSQTDSKSDEAQSDNFLPEEGVDILATQPEGEFAAPLNIPFGDKRRAVLYMPLDATKEDAEYVQEMIALMFKRVYKVDSNV